MKNSEITEEQQNALLRFFARIPTEKRLEIIKNSRKSFHILREQIKDKPLEEISYIALLQAIKKVQKNTTETELNLIRMRSKKLKHTKKREKLLSKWALIRTLRNEEGLSFRQISYYLAKFHKLEVAHSFIFEMWKKIEKNKRRKSKMNDEMIEEALPENISLRAIPLILDKQIYLIRAKEDDYFSRKSYLRSLLVSVRDELVTTNYADTRLLLSEIKLFDKGNKQNKFTEIVQKDGDKNLKLRLTNGHIYISKAEAMTITSIYEESKIGVSLQRLLEQEIHFTPQFIAKLLIDGNFLKKELPL